MSTIFASRQTCRACLIAQRGFKYRRIGGRGINAQAGDSKKYDILFCGSDSFSVASLDSLLKAPDVWSSIRVVVPQPKPVSQAHKGKRRAKLAERPLDQYRPTLREFASDHDLPVDQIDWKAGIASYTPPGPFSLPSPLSERNLLITASFGYILPDTFLDLFYRTHRLNVHPSLLPRWRGAAPIQWTIASGDETTGVSVQRLASKAKGIDAGKLVGVVDGIEVPPDATYWDLLPRLADGGGRLLVDTLRRMQAGTVEPIAQDPRLVTKAPKIKHETSRIRWSEQTAAEIARLARGIAHQEPLWTRLPMSPSSPSSSSSTEVQLLNPTAPPPSQIPTLAREGFTSIPVGTAILHKPTKSLYIAAAPERSPDQSVPVWEIPTPTFVKVEQVRPAGRKAMDVWEWFNGLGAEERAAKRVMFEGGDEGKVRVDIPESGRGIVL